MGVTVIGLSLGRFVQAAQVCRDTASMYVRGVDFSKGGNKDILVRLAHGFGMTRNGGNGVIILSKVTWISDQQCLEAELVPCNSNQHVITQRLVVGNQSLRQSKIGTPSVGLLDAIGQVNNYMQEGSAVAVFPFAQLGRGEFAYIAEAYFRSPNLDMAGFHPGTGVYVRAIF
jgi:hypothetical protein